VPRPVRDLERVERVVAELRGAGLDALLCALPSNVLLATGYWPVVGAAVAVVTRDGEVGLAAPEDEHELAAAGWADALECFAPGSPSALPGLVEAARPALRAVLTRLRVGRGRVGVEHGPLLEPSSYAGTVRWGPALPALAADLCPAAALRPADPSLARLRAALTPRELARVRDACTVTARAFELGAGAIRPGAREYDVAAAFAAPLARPPAEGGDGSRRGGFAFCMSGPNGARAFRSYARSGDRRLEPGDLVLVHCNSFLDGFWTDVTRTFCPGADERARALYEAVLAARDAAVARVAPGLPAREVDAAARGELARRGLGPAFRHGTGHGVGFAAIDHRARPRIHPASDDVLAEGMVFNLEPAVYLEGVGGLRQCEMVAVTAGGAEVLTPFQAGPDGLLLAAAGC